MSRCAVSQPWRRIWRANNSTGTSIGSNGMTAPRGKLLRQASATRAEPQHLVAEAVTRSQQQQLLAGQRRRVDGRRLLQWMAGGYQHHKWLFVHRLGQNPPLRKRQRQDQHIQVTLFEPLAQYCCIVLFDLQGHVGRAAVQAGNQVRQQVRADGVNHPQP